MAEQPDAERLTLTWGGMPGGAAGSVELPQRWSPIRALGEGGQGIVLLADDLELGEPVAVKVFGRELSPTSRERLRREVKLGRALSHPGLVRVFELIEAGDRLAIVMEWVPGGSVAERLRGGALPVAEVLGIAAQVLTTLAYLHGQQVVHRDVKPSNLLLGVDRGVKLADLGLARPLSGSDVTRTLAAVGTPAYLSPEQVLGQPASAATDLYALGVTLYELLTGRLPFADTGPDGLATRLHGRPLPPHRLRRDCPGWLSRFVLRLLEPLPGDRFRDAASALEALQRRGGGVSPRLRRQAGWAAAGVVAVATGVAAVVAARQPRIASVAASGSEVVALDAGGRQLWRRRWSAEKVEASVVELVPGAGSQALIALRDGATGVPEGEPDMFLIGLDGRDVLSWGSSHGRLSTCYPEMSPRTGGAAWSLLDIDGDGSRDLVTRSFHLKWYPAVLGAWSPATGRGPAKLLVNSGHLHDVRCVDVDGDGRLEMVVLGLNNPLGWHVVVAVLDVTPDQNERAWLHSVSPDLAGTWMATFVGVDGALRAYSVVATYGGTARLTKVGRDGIVVEMGGERFELDSDANPRGSPAFGRGPGLRQAFWNDLVRTCLAIEMGGTPRVADEFPGRHPEILAEGPSWVAAHLMLARAAARAGAHAEAVAVLDSGLRRVPGDGDLLFRRGEQLALAGRTDDASAALAAACPDARRGRHSRDVVVARYLLGVLSGRADLAAETMRRWRAGDDTVDTAGNNLDLEALGAFCRADWRDESLDPRSTPTLFRQVEVVRSWAMVERGGPSVEAGARAAALAGDPELASLARLLGARVALGEGRATEAGRLAAAALADLERRGRESLEEFAWVPLAERMLADALVAQGRADEAVAHRGRAARLAPGAWFGRP